MEREIRQLWLFSKHYFSLARKLKKKLPENSLNKTLLDISYKYPNPFDATGNDKRLMVMTAHLSSCSIRLCTIDERIEKNLGKSSRIFPNYLNEFKSSKKIIQLQAALRQNINKHIHQMLRDNVAHIERSPASKKQKGNLYEARQRVLESLTYQKTYDSVDKVLQKFKKELNEKNVL